MRVKEQISRIVRDTIRNYDFEEAINNAIEDIDIEEFYKDNLTIIKI